MIWKDLKIYTLQKIFAITGDAIVEDDTTKPYLKSMPAVANEALQLLSTAGRFIKKKISIEQMPPDSLEISSADHSSIVQDSGIYRYDLSALTIDFYSFGSNEIFLESDGLYGKTAGFSIEGESILVLDASKVGKWTIYYNAYPQQITKDTPDETDLSLHPEVAVLMPLYMASQLYKDDDIGQAVQYRNEFEVGRETLMMNASKQLTGSDSFVSSTGWW